MRRKKHFLMRLGMTILALMLTCAATYAEEITNENDLGKKVFCKYVTSSAEYSDYNVPENLFDGNVDTKWCIFFEPGAYIVFKTNIPLRISGYSLTTAEDTENFSGRNPRDWNLYGSYDRGQTWELIDQVRNDEVMQPENFASSYFLANAEKSYDYFKYEVEANKDDVCMQLSELNLFVKASDTLSTSILDTQTNLFTSVDQFSSPFTEEFEGSIEALIDGNPNTYWHSRWHDGDQPSGTHYIQIEVAELPEEFGFTFTRRPTTDDHVTRWSVYGVPADNADAAKDECTLLAKVETPYGSNTKTQSSPVILSQGFTIIRFYAEETNNYNRGYWHVSEFAINPVIQVSEIELAIRDVINVYQQYADYSGTFEAGTNPGNYGVDEVAAFEAALAAAQILDTPQALDLTIEQIQQLADDIKNTYNTVIATRVPLFSFMYSNVAITIDQEYTLQNKEEGEKKFDMSSLTWESSDNSVAIVENGIVKGIKEGNVTISALYNGNVINSCTVFCLAKQENEVSNEHEYVDMGLSVKWSTTVVGTNDPVPSSADECRFAWGDDSKKWGMFYEWLPTYKHGYSEYDLIKYCTDESRWSGEGEMDNLTELETCDDVASITWGEGWRTPSASEFEELFAPENTAFIFIDDYLGTGHTGFLVKSKIPGYKDNYIFLQGDIIMVTDQWGTGYWTRDIEEGDPSRALLYQVPLTEWCSASGRGGRTSTPRLEGLFVRPVWSENFLPHTEVASIQFDVEKLSLSEGESYTLQTSILPVDAIDQTLTWTSSSPEDVAVTQAGVITALTGNGAIITATANDGSGVKASCYVNMSKTIFLADGVEYTESATSDFEAIYYTRTFSSTDYQSLYVPFAMEYSDWSDKADIYKLQNIFENDSDDNGTVDEWVLRVIKLTDGSSTKANTPYVIKPKKSGDMTIKVTNTTLYPAEQNSIWCASTDYCFYFTGTHMPTIVNADTFFALSEGALCYSIHNTDLKAQRWYMEIRDKETGDTVVPSSFNPSANGTKAIRIFAEGEDAATGIHPIDRNATMQPAAIYNIHGQRLVAPVKGINIINGKKIVVK